jgi:excisionase family DNA binding protein
MDHIMHKTTYTLVEVAQLLRCHTETVRKAILDGYLQAAKLGRSYRVSRAELSKFWEAQGGGELFDKAEDSSSVPGTQLEPAPVSVKKAKKVGKKPEADQFTLPMGYESDKD